MPALIDSVEFKIQPLFSLPAEPDYTKAAPLLFRRTLAAGEDSESGTVGPRPGTVGQQTFYGRIIYRELNGKRHMTGFALDVAPYMPAYTVSPLEDYEYYT